MSISANAAAYLTEGSKKINEEKEKIEADKQFKKTIKKIDKGIFKQIKKGASGYYTCIENSFLKAKIWQYYDDLGYFVTDDIPWDLWNLGIFWSRDLIK